MAALTKALVRSRWPGLRWTICALACAPGSVAAQDCFPSKDSHEAQLFAALAVPLAFSLTEAPGPMDAGRIRVGLEVTYLPNPDAEIRTPTTCRPGKGPENTDQLFALPRPRAALGLPAGLVLEASWVPPIEVNGVKANLVGLSLQRTFPLGGREGALLALRAHGAFGLIRARSPAMMTRSATPPVSAFRAPGPAIDIIPTPSAWRERFPGDWPEGGCGRLPGAE